MRKERVCFLNCKNSDNTAYLHKVLQDLRQSRAVAYSQLLENPSLLQLFKLIKAPKNPIMMYLPINAPVFWKEVCLSFLSHLHWKVLFSVKDFKSLKCKSSLPLKGSAFYMVPNTTSTIFSDKTIHCCLPPLLPIQLYACFSYSYFLQHYLQSYLWILWEF